MHRLSPMRRFLPVRRLLTLLLISVFLGAATQLPVIPSAEAQVSGSGLPLPRFVSLRAGEVNLRTGPGVQYPVEWVYRKSGLPLEVIAEYKTWRKVRDWEGSQGWVHQTMLSAKRGFIVTGGTRDIRTKANMKAPAVARVQTGVSGRLVACPGGSAFCRVEVEGFEGWLNRADFWGVLKGEAFE